MVGCGAAAAADDVDQALGRELVQEARRDVGRLVEAGVAHRIGQPGVRVAADEGIARHAVQLLDVRPHQRRAQRAVQADSQRLRMANAVPERGDRLPAQDAARGVGHGAADDQRQALAAGLEVLVDREQSGLGVERVEDGFDQYDVGTTLDQRLGLLVVRGTQILEAGVARAGVVHVGADAGGLGRRAERAGDEARFVGRGELVAGRARQLGRFEVHLARQMRHLVVLLRDRGGAEGVGLDQVGTGRKVRFVNVRNHVGARQRQQLVVALHVALEVLEALAAVLRLGQLEALDHRAHRAVEDGNALREDLGQLLGAGVGDGLHERIVARPQSPRTSCRFSNPLPGATPIARRSRFDGVRLKKGQ